MGVDRHWDEGENVFREPVVMSPEMHDSAAWRVARAPRAQETKRRVLVVDDMAEARDMYCECLALHGFQAESAEDGAAGVAKAIASGPDVIILDFSMPRMDGGEVLRRLQSNERTRAIPVILVTAVLELVDVRVRSACAAFLEKPCEPDRLVDAVVGLLEPSDSSRPARSQ